MIAALTLAVAGVGRGVLAGDGGAATRPVVIKADVVSAVDRPYGCVFWVYEVPSLRLIATGSTDAHGSIEFSAQVSATCERLRLWASSDSMIAHTKEEWNGVRDSSDIRVNYLDLADRNTGRKWIPAWEAKLRPGESSYSESRILLREAGRNIGGYGPRGDFPCIDKVAATADVAGRDRAEFGVLKFPTAFALQEVVVDVFDAEGAPSSRSFIVSGWRGRSHRPGSAGVYEHMALAQTGNRVRVLLSRAGARLLLAHPADTIVLEAIADSAPNLARDASGPVVVSVSLDGAQRHRLGDPTTPVFVRATERVATPGDDLNRSAPTDAPLWDVFSAPLH